LIILQSAESLWRLWQEGYLAAVSILGDAPSIAQSENILRQVNPEGVIYFLTDNNKCGERCAAELFYDLGPHRLCRWLKLEEAQTPAVATREELQAIIPMLGN
jgi:hypothetical protein